MEKRAFRDLCRLLSITKPLLSVVRPNTAEAPLISWWSASSTEIGHTTLCNCFYWMYFLPDGSLCSLQQPPRMRRNALIWSQSSPRLLAGCCKKKNRICFHNVFLGNLSKPLQLYWIHEVPVVQFLPIVHEHAPGDSVDCQPVLPFTHWPAQST